LIGTVRYGSPASDSTGVERTYRGPFFPFHSSLSVLSPLSPPYPLSSIIIRHSPPHRLSCARNWFCFHYQDLLLRRNPARLPFPCQLPQLQFPQTSNFIFTLKTSLLPSRGDHDLYPSPPSPGGVIATSRGPLSHPLPMPSSI
jgi:hypothetical protein